MTQENDDNRPVSAAEIGRWVGVSERRIREMRGEGLLTSDAKGKYPLQDTILGFCAANRPLSGQSARGGVRGENSTGAQKERLAKEQADAMELKNAITRGNYLPVADAERVWGDVVRKLRAGLLAVPSRIRQLIPGLSADETAIIDHELREAMTELGRG